MNQYICFYHASDGSFDIEDGYADCIWTEDITTLRKELRQKGLSSETVLVRRVDGKFFVLNVGADK